MNNPTPQQLAEVIKKLRLDNNFTQAQVGAKLGVSRSTVSNIERGESDIPYSMLINLATTYNMGVGKLLWMAQPDKVSVSKDVCAPSIKSQKSWIVRFGEFIFGND